MDSRDVGHLRLLIRGKRFIATRVRLVLGLAWVQWAWRRLPHYEAPRREGARLRVAVHFHCFHLAYSSRFIAAMRNFPDADVFVSVVSEAAKRAFETDWNAVGSSQHLTVLVVRNAGRNFGPMLVELGPQLRTYDLLIHVHSKNPAGAALRRRWANFLWRWTLEDSRQVARVRDLFERDPTLGIYFPVSVRDVPTEYSWHGSEGIAATLMRDVFEGAAAQLPFAYPAGGMFWCRPSAISALFDLAGSAALYEEEELSLPLRKDGSTTEYAVERLVALVAVHGGWKRLVYLKDVNRFVVEQRFINPLIPILALPWPKVTPDRY